MALTREESIGLPCPECDHQDSRVIDTRGRQGSTGIWRRRCCLKCGHRFSTVEMRVQRPKPQRPAGKLVRR